MTFWMTRRSLLKSLATDVPNIFATLYTAVLYIPFALYGLTVLGL